MNDILVWTFSTRVWLYKDHHRFTDYSLLINEISRQYLSSISPISFFLSMTKLGNVEELSNRCSELQSLKINRINGKISSETPKIYQEEKQFTLRSAYKPNFASFGCIQQARRGTSVQPLTRGSQWISNFNQDVQELWIMFRENSFRRLIRSLLVSFVFCF